MLSNPPFPMSIRRVLALVLSAALTASLISLARDAVVAPTAQAAKRSKACKPGTRAASPKTVASAKRTQARIKSAIARYQARIQRLRRTGAQANRAAIRRHSRAVARLRRQLSCQTRYVSRSPHTGGLRVGLNADTQGWGSQMASRQDDVAPSGARWLREHFDWSVIEPSPGRYDWSRYDQLEVTASQRGFTVLPVLMSTPSWAGPSWDAIPSDPAAYANFVARVVARYGPGGEFWAAHPELASHAPQYFELWNEPYYPAFSAGHIDPARYARLVKAAGQAGKAVNRQAKFIAAAETDVQPTGSSRWVRWADAMYEAVPDLNDYFDAIAVHPYSKQRAPDAPVNGYIHDKFQRIETIRDHFSAHGGDDKPLWITEVGWSTCSPGNEECVNEDEQAEYTKRLFSVIQRRYRDTVGAVFLYRTIDLGPAGSSDIHQNYGLKREDGTPKPAWHALRAITGA